MKNVTLKLTPEQKRKLERAAKRDFLPAMTWLRQIALREVTEPGDLVWEDAPSGLTKMVMMKLTEKQKALIQHGADRAGMNVNQWLRALATREAERDD